MIRSTLTSAACFASLCVVVGCSSGGSSYDERAPAPKPGAVSRFDLPAPARVVFAFDRDADGTLPTGWTVAGTHQRGPLATWRVVADPTAPTKPHALSLASANHGSADTFNVCWSDRTRFRDGRLEVSFKANAGKEDQGGGPVWRVKDENNYYVCRVNPLEHNFRVYVVTDGSRRQLASAEVDIPVGEWHTIVVEHHGEHVECFLNGKKLLEANEPALPDAGGVGFWTKADATTSFDDLVVVPTAAQ